MRTAIATHELLPKGLDLQTLRIETGRVSIRVSSGTRRSVCPLCGRGSSRVHSRYARTVSDLPWHGIFVELEVLARRFFCDEASCERKIFCERLPEVAARARKTVRLEEALLAIALELGGRAGARLALELGIVAARDALLRRIKGAPLPEVGKVRVLGVDDFAFKKGNAYGTILVDLERHKVVDLLPECSQESLANWLRQHPGVEVATRDRSRIYREGIAKGAPQAAQVADRWHLLHGLALGLEEFLLRKRPALGRAAALGTSGEEERLPGSIDEGDVSTLPVRLGRPYGSVEGPAHKRHERLVERWKDIRRLHLAGASVKDIAEWVGTSQSTVYRFRELAEPPPRPGYKRRASVLDPYLPYLLGRWNEGCRSAKRLHQEIREMGYRHSVDTVNRLLSSFRHTEGQGKKLPLAPRAKRGSMAGATPTAKNVAALFMRREEMLSEEQKEYLQRLCASDRALADARRLTQDFAGMVRNVEGDKLDGWLAEAKASEAHAMKKFAVSLEKDLSAVRAGLTERWSNGPVEGLVNKLKLVKRQGYGRAGFGLLRARVLAA
ncbi:MAG: ISL3 family transposase [Rubrobacter sp.]|jgi:transposase|nr:ISL3 family transposase [Rubrobacter sp.]